MKIYFHGIGISMFFLLLACQESNHDLVLSIDSSLPEKIDYNFHIKPLLSDRCFKCHGPDANQRKAHLRLDVAESALGKTLLDEAKARRIIKPGRPGKSEVLYRITSDDPSYRMPPPESNLMLSDTEKALIAKWIEDGAEYKEHWAFTPPIAQKPPVVPDSGWIMNDIDRFILDQQYSRGLHPSDPANEAIILRRLTLDITGLPPTVQEMDNFFESSDEEKYEKAVDQLLASPRYGERMAVEWLDAARYADSHGYQDDGMRNTWPYRDWVITAFNDNMPYDRFLIEQLAGDLLTEPTKKQLIATCFNRNHPQTQEGGVVDEEYRVEYVADRVNTIGEAILGLTLECARCHDHKYDPISQEDYYSLYAFFNNINDTGIVPYNGEAAPTILLPTEAESKRLEELKSQMDPLKEKLVNDLYVIEFNQWLDNNEMDTLNEKGLIAHFDFEGETYITKGSLNLDKRQDFRPPETSEKELSFTNLVTEQPGTVVSGGGESPSLVDGYEGKAVMMHGDAGLRFSRDLDFDRHQPFSVSLWIKLLQYGEAGPIFNKTNGDFEGYRGWLCKLNEDGTLSFQFNHVWPDNCIDFQTVDTLAVGEWTHIALTYDGSSSAEGIGIYLNGSTPENKLHKDNLHKSLLHGVDGTNWSNLPFMLGVELRKSIQNMSFDELKVFDRELAGIEVRRLYEGQWRDEYDNDELLDYYLLSGQNARWNDVMERLTVMRKEENLLMTDILEVMITREKKYPRQTFLLDRGVYDAPKKMVTATVPRKLVSSEHMYEPNRMGLAKWIVSPENPFTARVQVNRIWMMLFGKGLVATQEDFGNQGDLPSHPELLDFLAVDFMNNGWDIKRLIKQIVMSATYRQSSIASADQKTQDPSNDWYTRFPAYRMSAEMIRDNALAASGLLTDSIGGPSVYPYQPEGLWEALATRNATIYIQGEGDDLYRRSLYTVWKRSSPPPAMMNFDAPDRYSCVVRRQKTSTPLQSLVLMNDPQFTESCRVLAQRVLLGESNGIPDVIDQVFKRLLCRPAEQNEIELLKKYIEDERNAFARDSERREALLDIGQFPVEGGVDKTDLAAWTMVVSTVMNHDEFVMKW